MPIIFLTTAKYSFSHTTVSRRASSDKKCSLCCVVNELLSIRHGVLPRTLFIHEGASTKHLFLRVFPDYDPKIFHQSWMLVSHQSESWIDLILLIANWPHMRVHLLLPNQTGCSEFCNNLLTRYTSDIVSTREVSASTFRDVVVDVLAG